MYTYILWYILRVEPLMLQVAYKPPTDIPYVQRKHK